MFDLYDNIGKIVVIKGIIFSDEESKEIDHCALTGRPCIVIDEIDDNMYLLPLSSFCHEEFKDQMFFLKKNSIIDDTKPGNKLIKLRPIIKRKMFSSKYRGELKPAAYYRLLKQVLLYYKTHDSMGLFEEMEDSINDKVLKLENRLQKKQD